METIYFSNKAVMRHMLTDKDMSNPHEFIEVMQDAVNDDTQGNSEDIDSVYGTLECEDENEDVNGEYDLRSTFKPVCQLLIL